jgi:hypothetical protein
VSLLFWRSGPDCCQRRDQGAICWRTAGATLDASGISNAAFIVVITMDGAKAATADLSASSLELKPSGNLCRHRQQQTAGSLGPGLRRVTAGRKSCSGNYPAGRVVRAEPEDIIRTVLDHIGRSGGGDRAAIATCRAAAKPGSFSAHRFPDDNWRMSAMPLCLLLPAMASCLHCCAGEMEKLPEPIWGCGARTRLAKWPGRRWPLLICKALQFAHCA